MGLHACSNCATSWALLALAVRIASALGLSSQDTTALSAFDVELRRRLWFGIGILDTQTSLDRGSAPLISPVELERPPANLNDPDLVQGMEPPKSGQDFTDMSFFSMAIEAMTCHKKLYQKSTAIGPGGSYWEARLAVVNSYEKSMARQYLAANYQTSHLQKFTRLVATKSLMTMQLLLRRPLYREQSGHVPTWDSFNVLARATDVLETSLQKRNLGEFAQWS